MRGVVGRKQQKLHVLEFILEKVQSDGDSEREIRTVRSEVSTFCSHYFSKLETCQNNFEYFENRFTVWLDNKEVFGKKTIRNVSEHDNLRGPCQGRPSTNFDESSERTKRLKTEPLRSSNSAACLLFAASMKFREEGKEPCSKLLKLIVKDPCIAEQILEFLRNEKVIEKPVKMTNQAALSLILDADLGKSQYLAIRACGKNHNANIFPSYNNVLEEKKNIFPPEKIAVTEVSAEIRLQDLLDYDAQRVVQLLESNGEISNLPAQLEFLHKWGVDGSGEHSQYQQAFSGSPPPPSADQSVLLTAISPLQLRELRDGLPSRAWWENPTPSSIRFCKPIRLQFKKETKDSIKDEERYITSQSEALLPSTVTTSTGKVITIIHKLTMTMIDGKARTYLTDTASFSRCCLCDATPNEMQNYVERPVDVSAFKYGLSILHARIRFLECVLHVSYRSECKQWAANKAVIKNRKKMIIDSLREEVGILVDSVKRGSGSTNNGNSTRRFFANLDVVHDITNFDRELLERFATILDTLSCGYEVDVGKFREYCLETHNRFQALYGRWYKIPSSVHLILIHGADIMASLELPIGAYSEEALEARNKNIRAFR